MAFLAGQDAGKGAMWLYNDPSRHWVSLSLAEAKRKTMQVILTRWRVHSGMYGESPLCSVLCWEAAGRGRSISHAGLRWGWREKRPSKSSFEHKMQHSHPHPSLFHVWLSFVFHVTWTELRRRFSHPPSRLATHNHGLYFMELNEGLILHTHTHTWHAHRHSFFPLKSMKISWSKEFCKILKHWQKALLGFC